MSQPILKTFPQVASLMLQKYERYLPSAFDESMTLLEKVNKIIISLNQIGELTNDVVDQWNTVMEWIIADGINDKVVERLNQMVEDGTMDGIINQTLFGDLNARLDSSENNIVSLQTDRDDLKTRMGQAESNISTHGVDLNNLQEEHDNLSNTVSTIQTKQTSIGHDIMQRGVNALNYASLQEALDVGGLVVLPWSTYDVTATLKVPSNTHIIGLGKATLRRAAVIDSIMLNKSDGFTGAYGANQNITIENIIFDANGQAYTGNVTSLAFGHCKNVKILECQFLNNYSSWHELEVNACMDVIIKGNKFEDYHGASEMLQLDFMAYDTQFPWFGPYDHTVCKNVYIEENVFRGVDRTKKAIGNHTFVAGCVTRNVHIRNNVFEELGWALSLNDVHDLYFEGNYMYNVIKGIYYQEQQNSSQHWVIDKNKFLNEGVYTETDAVEGRFFEGFTTFPQFGFYDVFITGNEIYKTRTHAIGLTCTQGAIITGNNISFAGKSGIYVYGGKDVLVSNNFVTSSNTQGETTRADIQIGNNGDVSALYVNVEGNNVATINCGSTIASCFIHGNFIKSSFVTADGVTSKNNIINGAYVA